jgi:hypothetical protein
MVVGYQQGVARILVAEKKPAISALTKGMWAW